MFVALADYLTQFYSGFNVFSYLTLRSILAVITALGFALWVGPMAIRRLTAYKVGQHVRSDGPQSHLSKSGTPTMGGLIILAGLALATLLWADLGNRFVWIALLVTLAFGLIGGIDDFRKLAYANSKGLSARQKLVLQTAIALTAALILYFTAQVPAETQLIVPFFKDVAIDLGWFYVVLATLVIVGASNAVNLTDGLDGLAIMPVILVAGGLGIFVYLTGNRIFSEYLVIPYIAGVGEIAVFCAALSGAGLGFLWFNTYPALVFMGDTGALALGAALGVVAVITRQELVLFIMGGIFVIETLSVILQVGHYKLTRRRLFKMAPIHHHFELMGWPEPRVIVRFWIVSLILVLVGLATLKVR